MAEQFVDVDRMEHTLELFGSFDENIKILEAEYGVTILNRGTQVKLSGNDEGVDAAARAVRGILELLNNGEALNQQNVRYIINLVAQGEENKVSRLTGDLVCITSKGRPVRAKTLGQKSYVEAISKNTITLSVGSAGTGKTYLAVAMAVKAFRANDVNKIILTRPAVEAGEKLGFLPGDL
ncbi:MAG: PhoH family protein, partial [Oscillospiraceae bacterium]